MTQKFFRSLVLLFFVFCSPTAKVVAENSHEVTSSQPESGYLLTQRNSKKNSQKPKKKRKKETPPPEVERDDEKSPSEPPSDALASQRTFRGLIGFYMGSKSVLVFGAGATLPYSKTIALDGGFDYFKIGNEYASISVMRFTGGAGYIIPTGPDSTFRLGGRGGLMNFSFSSSIPPLFEGDETTSSSFSKTLLYVEGRLAYEVKLTGGLIGGAELQIPLYVGDESASSADSIAVYGSLGMTF